jgi:hypothetical protein
MCTFSEESALTKCSPEPFAVWNKKLEGLENSESKS